MQPTRTERSEWYGNNDGWLQTVRQNDFNELSATEKLAFMLSTFVEANSHRPLAQRAENGLVKTQYRLD